MKPYHVRSLPAEWTRADDAEEGDPTTFAFVAATPARVRVFDPSRGRIIRESLSMGGMVPAPDNGVIALDSHRSRGSEHVIGRARGLSIVDGKLRASITFSISTEAGLRNRNLVRDRALDSVSIGYDVTESRETGEETDGEPHVDATTWAVRELSTAPIPADPDALLVRHREAVDADSAPPPAVPVPDQPPAPKAADTGPSAEDLRAERDALGARFLAICPASLREWAEERVDGWILARAVVEQVRSELHAEWTGRRKQAVGATHHGPGDTDPQKAGAARVATTTHEMTADDFGRALRS